MNFYNLFNTYRPRSCHNAAFPWQAVATGGAGALNAGTTLYTNSQNLKHQQAENEKNRKFSHDEAELARNWQSQEWLKQYNLQREEWYNQQKELANQNYQQFLKEAEYNSPTNQVSRLGKAGFNPSAVLSGNGTGLVSAASGNMQNVGNISVPSGGAQSGAVASAPSSSLPPQQSVDLSFIGSMFRDFSEASKTNKTLQPLLDQMAQQTNLLMKQVVGQELTNEFNEVQNQIAAATKSPKIQQAFADLGYTYAETYLQYKNGEKIDSEILVNKTLEFLNKIKGKCAQEEYLQLVFAVEHLDESFQNILQNDASQRALNYANAANASADAETKEKVRYWVVEHEKEAAFIAGLEHKMALNDWILSEQSLRPKIIEVAISLERNQIINKQLRVELEMAINNRDWQTVDRIVGYIRDLIGVGAQATVGGAALKTSLKKPVAPASRSIDGYRVRRPDY